MIWRRVRVRGDPFGPEMRAIARKRFERRWVRVVVIAEPTERRATWWEIRSGVGLDSKRWADGAAVSMMAARRQAEAATVAFNRWTPASKTSDQADAWRDFNAGFWKSNPPPRANAAFCTVGLLDKDLNDLP